MLDSFDPSGTEDAMNATVNVLPVVKTVPQGSGKLTDVALDRMNAEPCRKQDLPNESIIDIRHVARVTL